MSSQCVRSIENDRRTSSEGPTGDEAAGVRGMITPLRRETTPLIPPAPNGPISQAPTPHAPTYHTVCGSTRSQNSGDMNAAALCSPTTSWDKNKWPFMFFLTISMPGLQLVWSVETAYVSPYMLSLGLTKQALAIVLIAGPLSGVLVQPYIGAQSDRCTCDWGRRSPFIVGGAAATVFSLICLPRAREQAHWLLDRFFNVSGDKAYHVTAIVWAIVLLCVLDCAINTMQAGIRAFIVDNAPTHQQERANAWATRMSGFGNIIGFAYGSMNTSHIRKGDDTVRTDDQFTNMCTFALVILIVAVLTSLKEVREEKLTTPPTDQPQGIFAFFKELCASLRHLPKQIKAVCYVQFFAWVGWFPILFYTTTYIAEIHVSNVLTSHPTDGEIKQAWKEGIRRGAQALFLFAITSFIASWLLPLIVSHPFFRAALHLRNTWLLSHGMFAILMFSTFFIQSAGGAKIMLAWLGIPWAMTLWAPFALIAAEIKRLQDLADHNSTGSDNDNESEIHSEPGGDVYSGDEEANLNASKVVQHVPQAGIVLGIHNVAIAAPQVIAAVASSVWFEALEKLRGSAEDNSVAWVLRFGGVFAIVAMVLTVRVRKDAVSENGQL